MLHSTTRRGKRNDKPRAHGTRKKTHPQCCTAYSPTHSSIRQVILRYYNIIPPPQHKKTKTSPHGHIILRMRAPQDQPIPSVPPVLKKEPGYPTGRSPIRPSPKGRKWELCQRKRHKERQPVLHPSNTDHAYIYPLPALALLLTGRAYLLNEKK